MRWKTSRSSCRITLRSPRSAQRACDEQSEVQVTLVCLQNTPSWPLVLLMTLYNSRRTTEGKKRKRFIYDTDFEFWFCHTKWKKSFQFDQFKGTRKTDSFSDIWYPYGSICGASTSRHKVCKSPSNLVVSKLRKLLSLHQTSRYHNPES